MTKAEIAPFVSVIIPVYNDAARIGKCLGALENQSYPADRYEVIVVDNGLNKNIEEIAAKFKHARLLREERPGESIARNKGIDSARGEILAFTDSDCIPADKWIEKGAETLRHAPGCGQIGGNIAFYFKRENDPNIIEQYDFLMHLKNKMYVENYHFAAGANIIAFKTVFDRVGRFNESLKSSCDYELGQRIFASGYKQLYSDEARVFHPARNTFTALCSKQMRIASGNSCVPSLKFTLKKIFIDESILFARESVAFLGDRSIGSLARRMQFVLIHFAVKIAVLYEIIRLFFGGKPRR